jgi:hypothetical protein
MIQEFASKEMPQRLLVLRALLFAVGGVGVGEVSALILVNHFAVSPGLPDK